MRTSTLIRLLPLTVLALGVGSPAARAAEPAEPMRQAVEQLDRELFDAYNACDLETFGKMLAEDIEFYHDVTGLARGRQAIVEAVRNNICGKVRRELVPGTLEVYPLGDYGAVEIGVHRFHHPGHDDTEPVGEAKFAQIWHHLADGRWELARVLSYDHHALDAGVTSEGSAPGEETH
jgi:uncharacterized protein (TIGR02246 family)